MEPMDDLPDAFTSKRKRDEGEERRDAEAEKREWYARTSELRDTALHWRGVFPARKPATRHAKQHMLRALCPPDTLERLQAEHEAQELESTTALQLCASDVLPPGVSLFPMPVFGRDKRSLAPSDDQSGKKEFVVASYEQFWERYAATPAADRNYYEVNVRGVPCHLHVDAEFSRELNPSVTPERERWLEETLFARCTSLLVELGVAAAPQDVTYHTLEASNAKKFSRHYIVKVRGRCFRNNLHCGAFMRRLANRLVAEFGDEDTVGQPTSFFFQTLHLDPQRKGETLLTQELLFDLCVYTKYRQFRLYGSTKRAGAFRPLVLVGENPQRYELRRETFLELLIQRVLPGTLVYDCLEETTGEEPASTSHKYFFRTDAKYASQQQHQQKGGGRIRSFNLGLGGAKVKVGSHTVPIERASQPCTFLEELASCMENLWCISAGGGESPQLYGCAYNAEHDSLYFKSRSKACSVAGREHASNHIGFRVDLRAKRFYQSCFDAEPPCNIPFYVRGGSDAPEVQALSDSQRERWERARAGHSFAERSTLCASIDAWLRTKESSREEREVLARTMQRLCLFYRQVPLEDRQ